MRAFFVIRICLLTAVTLRSELGCCCSSEPVRRAAAASAASPVRTEVVRQRDRDGTLEFSSKFPVSSVEQVQVSVNGSSCIATVDDEFLCATLDWWPPTKCNYDSCPWHLNSLLNLNLDNSVLEAAITALAPLRLRLGGTLEDNVVYDIGFPTEPCVPFVANSSYQFGFTGGCLPMERWDVLNEFFIKTGVSVAFGLNKLYGTTSGDTWDSSNAIDFIRYTHDRKYPITAWELGNELMGADGIGQQVSPAVYGKQVQQLRRTVDEIYKNDVKRPLVIAPDSFYQAGSSDYRQFLDASGPNVVDVVTRHIYNLGPGSTSTDELVDTILDRNLSIDEEYRYANLQDDLKDYPWASAWVGESGGAYNSGHENVTDSFIMAFWYLDQLGLASKHNNGAFCRQTLIGGHYGLLNSDGSQPNPDFFAILLWRKLMGNGVLSVNLSNSSDIRAYAHCQKDSTHGGVTLLLLNYNRYTEIAVDVALLKYPTCTTCTEIGEVSQEPVSDVPRQEYHMTAPDSDIHSHVVLLNGSPLNVSKTGEMPALPPRKVSSLLPVVLGPLTYAFVVFQNASLNACPLAS